MKPRQWLMWLWPGGPLSDVAQTFSLLFRRLSSRRCAGAVGVEATTAVSGLESPRYGRQECLRYDETRRCAAAVGVEATTAVSGLESPRYGRQECLRYDETRRCAAAVGVEARRLRQSAGWKARETADRNVCATIKLGGLGWGWRLGVGYGWGGFRQPGQALLQRHSSGVRQSRADTGLFTT